AHVLAESTEKTAIPGPLIHGPRLYRSDTHEPFAEHVYCQPDRHACLTPCLRLPRRAGGGARGFGRRPSDGGGKGPRQFLHDESAPAHAAVACARRGEHRQETPFAGGGSVGL